MPHLLDYAHIVPFQLKGKKLIHKSTTCYPRISFRNQLGSPRRSCEEKRWHYSLLCRLKEINWDNQERFLPLATYWWHPRCTTNFSTLDLRSGYWQIELQPPPPPPPPPPAKEKTAFITHKGLYEFTVLPFGLCNSPSTFQRLMKHVLRGLNWKTCMIYIDDIIIYSRSFEEHLQHLEDVFLRRRHPYTCYTSNMPDYASSATSS